MNNHTKNVIHVVQHLAPGGLESLALNMLTFSNPEHHVLIVSLEGSKQEAISHWPRLGEVEDHLVFLDKPAGFSFTTLHRLYKLFRTLKPTTVHTHHIGPIIYGAIAARFANVKARIHTEHDAWHLSNPKHCSLQKLALAIAKPSVVADAKLVKDQLFERLNYHDVSVINNGIDCQRFKPGSKPLARQALGLPLSSTIIGSAGRLEHVKGHDILLDAMVLLPKDIYLVIAGAGSKKEALEQQAQRLGISQRVIFLGLVDDMCRFYQSLDLFCLPSRSEGYPLSTLEAQACDIVTVTSDVGACSETLCPITGSVVESNNPNALAEVLLNNLSDRHDTHSPREFVLKNNDIRQMVKAYDQLAVEKSA